MKYILKPFWLLVIIIYTLTEICLCVIANIWLVLWYFNFKHLYNWEDFTQQEWPEYYGRKPGYDKNPIETVYRRINDSNKYQNHRK